jgi:hypothetical protein
MKKSGLLIMAFMFTCGLLLQAQNKDEQRKAKEDAEYKTTSNMLDSMSFVLEAYTLRDQWGNIANVSSSLNFIRVDSTQAVMQIGSNSRIGPNGVGGVTAKGRVSKWKLDKNEKRKSFTLNFTVISPIGIYDILMFINSNGNATATISGLDPGKLIYNGNLVPLSQSRVYEGQSL